jgi:hypothetical protein
VESQSIGQPRQRNDILKYFLRRMADAGYRVIEYGQDERGGAGQGWAIHELPNFLRVKNAFGFPAGAAS